MGGFGLEDLPDVYREEFLYAVEMARGKHDPGEEWVAFRETLWSYLVRVFGLDEPGVRAAAAAAAEAGQGGSGASVQR